MVNEKLLPCPTPWCDDEEKYVWQGPDDRFRIICGCCQVEGPAADDQQEAIAAWNTRAPADLRSALETIAKTGEGWGTSGDGHAKCIQIARAALAPTKEPAA